MDANCQALVQILSIFSPISKTLNWVHEASLGEDADFQKMPLKSRTSSFELTKQVSFPLVSVTSSPRAVGHVGEIGGLGGRGYKSHRSWYRYGYEDENRMALCPTRL